MGRRVGRSRRPPLYVSWVLIPISISSPPNPSTQLRLLSNNASDQGKHSIDGFHENPPSIHLLTQLRSGPDSERSGLESQQYVRTAALQTQAYMGFVVGLADAE